MEEAKTRSLACAETMTVDAQQQCRYNAAICSDSELCQTAEHKGSWRLVTAGDHVAEAKKRGLSCGVGKSNTEVLRCNIHPDKCNDIDLCERSTEIRSGSKLWKADPDDRHVAEASAWPNLWR